MCLEFEGRNGGVDGADAPQEASLLHKNKSERNLSYTEFPELPVLSVLTALPELPVPNFPLTCRSLCFRGVCGRRCAALWR